MRLTFLQQMEQTANVLGDQGTSSIPALRKTFSEDDELREEPGEPMRGELRLVWKSDIVDFRYEFDQDLPI